MSETSTRYAIVLGAALAASAVIMAPAYSQSARKVVLSKDAMYFVATELNFEQALWNKIPISAYLASIDLNGNGHDEHLIQIVSSRTCSNGVATCAWIVYEGPPNRRKVLQTQAHVVRLLPRRSNGWQDIEFENGTYDGVIVRTFRYDGRTYRLETTRNLGPLYPRVKGENDG